MQGYIKLHRQLLDWEWYSDINVCRFFLHCLLKANHEEKRWQGILIPKGSFVTSYENLSIETSLTIRQIRTAINKLKTTNELTHEGHTQYSIISINNWDKFQTNDKQNDKQTTNERQTNDKRATTNKNDKNDKNDKNNIINIVEHFKKPTIEEIQNYCFERKNTINPQNFYDYYESNGWKVGKNKMKDWKAAVRTWESNERKNQTSNRPNKENGWEL